MALFAWTDLAAAAPPNLKDEANRLFYEGNTRMAEGDIRTACERYAESLALLRRGGTLLNLALCREAAGELDAARSLFEEALDVAIRDERADREQVARQHITALRKPPPIAQPAPTAAPEPGPRIPEPPDPRPAPRVEAGAGSPPAAATPEVGLAHRWQFGAVARVDVDPIHPGARAVAGVTFGLGDQLELGASALIGRDMGLEPQLTVYLLHRTAWKPLINAGVPIFFMKGPDAGVRGSAGVQWDYNRHFGLFAQVGGAYFSNAPAGYARGVLLPALGAQGRL